MSEVKCVATREGGIDPNYVKRCPRRATHGEWCRQHAESLGGWRLAAPQPESGLREAADKAERACRKFITGTFDRTDEAMARMALDDLRAALVALDA